MLVRPWVPAKPAFYLRASTEHQEQLQTVETQRRFLWKHLEQLGFDPGTIPEYCDDGVTGTISIFSRSDGTRMMEDARRGRFESLYVYAVDRVGREALWVLEAEHHLRALGIKLQSATQNFDPSEVTGAFLLTLLAGQAQMEKTQIIGRLFHGATRCAEDGYWIGGRMPYGYKPEWIGKRKRLALCDDPFPTYEQWNPVKVIRWLFQRCYEDRVTCVTLAHELNALAMPTYWVPGSRYAPEPQREEWLASRVLAILKCEAYAGVHVYAKTTQRGRDPIRRACPAIISPELFAECQLILSKNRNLAVRPRGRAYLLRGLVQCAHCGRNYCGSGRFHEGKGRHVYMCAGRMRYSPSLAYCRCSHWIDADQLEEDVKAVIRSVIAHPEEALEELRSWLSGEENHAGKYLEEITSLEKQQAALSTQEQEYIRLRAVGMIKNDTQLAGFLKEIDEKRQALQERVLALHQKVAGCRHEQNTLEASAELLAQLKEAGQHPMTDAEWRAFFELWVVGITVTSSGEGKRKSAVGDLTLRVPVPSQAVETLTLWRRFIYCPNLLRSRAA